MVEVREELRLLGRSAQTQNMSASWRGCRGARRGTALPLLDNDEERLALNAERQGKQLMAWQGLERRLTARRNLALKKLSDILDHHLSL